MATAKYTLRQFADLLNNGENYKNYLIGLQAHASPDVSHSDRLLILEGNLHRNMDGNAAYWLGRLKATGYFDN